MKKNKYTQEQLDYIKENVATTKLDQLLEMFNSKFDMSITKGQLKSIKGNHKFVGITKWPKEVEKFIIDNSKGNNSEKLRLLIQDEYGISYKHSEIEYKRYRLGAKSGIDSIQVLRELGKEHRFKKGHIPSNAIKKGQRISIRTEFKKGNRPSNFMPVGTIKEREGILYKKIAITKPSRFGWKAIHVMNWEEANGPVPKGHKLVFLDGDKSNTSVDNLELVTNKQMLILNQNELLKADKELSQAAIGIARLLEKIYDKVRG